MMNAAHHFTAGDSMSCPDWVGDYSVNNINVICNNLFDDNIIMMTSDGYVMTDINHISVNNISNNHILVMNDGPVVHDLAHFLNNFMYFFNDGGVVLEGRVGGLVDVAPVGSWVGIDHKMVNVDVIDNDLAVISLSAVPVNMLSFTNDVLNFGPLRDEVVLVIGFSVVVASVFVVSKSVLMNRNVEDELTVEVLHHVVIET